MINKYHLNIILIYLAHINRSDDFIPSKIETTQNQQLTWRGVNAVNGVSTGSVDTSTPQSHKGLRAVSTLYPERPHLGSSSAAGPDLVSRG
jgi:hypothetical protein